jgi:hypothetical protein
MRPGVLVIVLLLVRFVWEPAETGAADTQTMDGNELLRRCTSALQTLDTGQGDLDTQTEASWCLGYVLGFSAGQTAEHVNSTLPSPMLCPPQGWPPAWQLVRILVAWLRTHPTDLHLDHPSVMLLAFANAFPCSSAVTTPPTPPPTGILRPPAPKTGKGKQ